MFLGLCLQSIFWMGIQCGYKQWEISQTIMGGKPWKNQFHLHLMVYHHLPLYDMVILGECGPFSGIHTHIMFILEIQNDSLGCKETNLFMSTLNPGFPPNQHGFLLHTKIADKIIQMVVHPPQSILLLVLNPYPIWNRSKLDGVNWYTVKP